MSNARLKNLTTIELLTITLSALSFIVSCSVLFFGDSIYQQLIKPKIIFNEYKRPLNIKNNPELSISMFNIYNTGGKPSDNIKIVLVFTSPLELQEIQSDETITSSTKKSAESLEISLNRFSPRSSINISHISKNSIELKDAYYIDNEGKSTIEKHNQFKSPIIWLDILLVCTILASIILILIIFRRANSRLLLNNFSELNSILNKKIDTLASTMDANFVGIRNNLANFSIDKDEELPPSNNSQQSLDRLQKFSAADTNP